MKYRIGMALLAGSLLALAGPASAVPFFWTNQTDNASGYWTNGVLWNFGNPTFYPGSSSSDEAYLTNQFAGTYTNILNANLTGTATITTMAISNSLGEAWLIVTNNLAGTGVVLTNGNFRLNSGGRLQIDDGGRVRINSTITWLGTNGTIYLNKGSQLDSAGHISLDAGSVTGLVTSASGPGNGGLWNFLGANLTVGESTDYNLLRVTNGVILSNITTLAVGRNVGSDSNYLSITEGSRLFLSGGALMVGGREGIGGGSGNTLILSNSVLKMGASSSSLTVGWGSSNNTLTLLANTVVDNTGQGINVGGNINGNANYTAFSAGNVMIVNDALVTNAGKVVIGYGADQNPAAFIGISNRLEVLNGGVISNVTLLAVGGRQNAGIGSDYNSLIVTSANSGFFMTTAGSIRVGASGLNGNANGGSFNTVILSNSVLLGTFGSVGWGSTSNTVTLLANSLWNNGGGGLTIGGGTALGNSLTVNGGILTNIGTFLVGSGANGNAAFITNGGLLVANTVQAGSSANNNSILVTDGGILQANSLSIGAGTGNTISNRNATYQFTAAPTVTSITPGDIALTDGTISFRTTGAANVATNYRIAFAAANTFALNNASNTMTGVNQTYTFNAISGNPSNYARLVMVNGTTAYGNAAGANITIGLNGSMLVSNTTATVSGLVTNTGSLSFVNAQATFQQRVYNTGTNQMLSTTATFAGGAINTGHWITDPTTNIFGSFGLTNSGAINMAAGDVYIFGNTVTGTPADFINISTNKTASDTIAGKFVFSGGLGLTQTFAVAGHDFDAADTATNLVYTVPPGQGFVNNFSLGTLELSNFSTVRVTDAFFTLAPDDGKMAGLYLENLFLGMGSLLIIETNVQVYFKNSNAWSLANIQLEGNSGYVNSISGLHQIVVIPEPSVLLLCVAGFATIWLSRRRHQRKRLL